MLNITLDLTSLTGGKEIDETLSRAASYAVKALVERGREIWVEYANGASMPNGKRVGKISGQYARSIESRMTGALSGEVFTNNTYAGWLEHGGDRDLKKMLLTSDKTRRGKNGKLYLIIPFRHQVPGALLNPQSTAENVEKGMTQAIYAIAKELKASVPEGKYTRISATGDAIPSTRWRWGGRLAREEIERVSPSAANARHLAGMVKMNRAGQTQYRTFRVMSEDSKGWVIRGFTGYQVAEQTARRVEASLPRVMQGIEDGLKDL